MPIGFLIAFLVDPMFADQRIVGLLEALGLRRAALREARVIDRDKAQARWRKGLSLLLPISSRCCWADGSDTRRPSYTASEINRQISGLMRKVVARNIPRSGGTVAKPQANGLARKSPNRRDERPGWVAKAASGRQPSTMFLRGNTHGDDIGKAHLPSLIDEEIIQRLIEIGTRKEPCRPAIELMIALGRRRTVIVGVRRSSCR